MVLGGPPARPPAQLLGWLGGCLPCLADSLRRRRKGFFRRRVFPHLDSFLPTFAPSLPVCAPPATLQDQTRPLQPCHAPFPCRPSPFHPDWLKKKFVHDSYDYDECLKWIRLPCECMWWPLWWRRPLPWPWTRRRSRCPSPRSRCRPTWPKISSKTQSSEEDESKRNPRKMVRKVQFNLFQTLAVTDFWLWLNCCDFPKSQKKWVQIFYRFFLPIFKEF